MMSTDIFDRLKGGDIVRLNEPAWSKVADICTQTLALQPSLNASTSVDETRSKLSEIIGSPIDSSTVIFVPFHTNFGRFIKLGKNVFINHACTFLDLGGITVEDDVLIGPKVNIITENHPLDPSDRRALICKRVLIKRNAWIGAGATILPGITIGENSVVAAGSVVTKDVPDNVVVGGVPANIIKPLV
jgi:acetyltransferase-like isoleucine patch superfamily enzyme